MWDKVDVPTRVGAVGDDALSKKRIELQGVLLLLNSFNKHLTFTERKINTQEVTRSPEKLAC